MSSPTPGTSRMAKRRRGTTKRRSYTLSSSSTDTYNGDSKKRKSKRKHWPTSSDTCSSSSSSSSSSSGSHSRMKHRYARKKRALSSDSSRSSSENKSIKRRRRKSSSSESTPKRATKRKITPKAKTLSESSGDISSLDNDSLHKSRISTSCYSSLKTPKARKTSDRSDKDFNDVHPLNASMVSMAASQKRAAKWPRLCHTLSAKESRGQEVLSECTSTYSGTAAEQRLWSDIQDGAQNNVLRLAADQDQKASSSEDGSEKNMKRQSNFTDHSVSKAGQMTAGEASHDTCESESSSDSELDNNQEPVKGAPEDSDLPPTEGQPPPPTNPELVAALADLIFDIIFEVLWHFIESFVPPQHA